MSERPSPPRVFVSYSDDSVAHAKRVLELAQWLRSHGVDAQLDQFEESPEEGWPRWVYRQIREAEYVLIIATPGYLRRCEGEEPRVSATDSLTKFGSHLTLQELHDAGGRNRKFVPVLFEGDAVVESVPLPLRGATCYRLPDQRDDLYRRLTGQPKVQRAPLGVLKTFDDESLLDSVDEYGDPGLRARSSFDEQHAEDSLRAIIDAGLREDAEPEAPRPRWRRSWLQTNRQWLISAAAFGAAFMIVGLWMGKRGVAPGDPTCRIQLTDDDGNVVEGINRVILELPSGDEIQVVVEDGRTLKFACLPSTVQAQAHVFFDNRVEVATHSPDQPEDDAMRRLDGRIELKAAGESNDAGVVMGEGIVQAKLVEAARPIPPPPTQVPERLDPVPINPDSTSTKPPPDPKPSEGIGSVQPGGPIKQPSSSPAKVTAKSADKQVNSKLYAASSALRRCYERGLAKDPTLRGRIVADLRIDTKGTVNELELVERLGDRDVTKCVTDLIEGWQLSNEEPRGRVARITIEFAPP